MTKIKIFALALATCLATPAIAQTAPAPASTAPVAPPRILKIDGKEFKVWGVPASRRFTVNELFKNPAIRCPTLMSLAEDVTDPEVLAKLKRKHPEVEYWYHFRCLDNPPS